MTFALAVWFAASLLCDVCGQLCFKRGAQTRTPEGQTPWSAFVNVWVLAGIAVYAIEVMVWLRILSRVPLAVAFPIASLNFLAITVASAWWLGERVSPRRWGATLLVTAGVVLVAQGA